MNNITICWCFVFRQRRDENVIDADKVQEAVRKTEGIQKINNIEALKHIQPISSYT